MSYLIYISLLVLAWLYSDSILDQYALGVLSDENQKLAVALGWEIVPALRVSLSTPTDCVAPLDKGAAIACEARLAVNVDKLTELAIITLKEH